MNTNTTLNILVVDDENNHRRAAHSLLKDHNLTVVGSYEEAAKLLTAGIDYDKLRELRTESGNAPYPRNGTDAEKAEWNKMTKELEEKAYYKPNFDVVLLDLLMPAPATAQGGEGMAHVGKPMGMGAFLILLAIDAGVTRIGMVTDMNHHHHPASAALDPINRKVIKAGDLWIFATNYPGLVRFDSETGEYLSRQFLETEEGTLKYPKEASGGYSEDRVGTFTGKGWNGVLRTLLGGADGTQGA